MFRFDRKKFFDIYKNAFGRLNQSQVDGLETLLGFIEDDTVLSDLRHFAYMLATIKHECDDKWQPIEEYSKGKGKAYGKRSKTTGLIYYGRGYTQTTWEENYRKVSSAWNRLHPDEPVNFVRKPELLLIPRYSYFATSYAMSVGLYTGKKLTDYINDRKKDYREARRIINILDKADLIASYANSFEGILRASQYEPKISNETNEVKEEVATQPAPSAIIPSAIDNVSAQANEPAPATVSTPVSQAVQIATGNTSTIAKLAAPGGMLASAIAWVESHPGLVATIVVCGTLVFLVIYFRESLEKLLEAKINADPNLHNIHFQRKVK